MGEACLLSQHISPLPGVLCCGSSAGVDDREDVLAQGAQWFALKVRTGCEPAAAAALTMRGLEVYSPMRQERRRYSDRMKTVRVAVFPGYVFCRFDILHKLPVISSPGIEYIVGFSGKATPIRDNDLVSIRRMVDAGAEITPTLVAGQRVRVTHGSLAGVEGILVRDGKTERLVVSIELLQHSASLYIHEDALCAVA